MQGCSTQEPTQDAHGNQQTEHTVPSHRAQTAGILMDARRIKRSSAVSARLPPFARSAEPAQVPHSPTANAP